MQRSGATFFGVGILTKTLTGLRWPRRCSNSCKKGSSSSIWHEVLPLANYIGDAAPSMGMGDMDAELLGRTQRRLLPLACV